MMTFQTLAPAGFEAHRCACQFCEPINFPCGQAGLESATERVAALGSGHGGHKSQVAFHPGLARTFAGGPPQSHWLSGSLAPVPCSSPPSRSALCRENPQPPPRAPQLAPLSTRTPAPGSLSHLQQSFADLEVDREQNVQLAGTGRELPG